jgi:hypothetical protein
MCASCFGQFVVKWSDWQGVKAKFWKNPRADFAGAVLNFLTQSLQP